MKKLIPKIFYQCSLEKMVPVNDYYRLLEKALNLDFVYDLCRNLYGNTGNPSLDPIVFFKLSMVGYLENITSDRALAKRVADSLSIRRFIQYDLDEITPAHNTISHTRKLIPEKVFYQVFDHILYLCVRYGLVSGTHQSVDSSLVKANADMDNMEPKVPVLSMVEYVSKVQLENRDASENPKEADEEPVSESKLSVVVSSSKENKNKRPPFNNQNFQSKSDPDARLARKPGTPCDLYYNNNLVVDAQENIITYVQATHSDIGDRQTFVPMLDEASFRLKKFGLELQSVSADSNYCRGENLAALSARSIDAFIPIPAHPKKKNCWGRDKFIYDAQADCYICPEGKTLSYKATDNKKKMKIYRASASDCQVCSSRKYCTTAKKTGRKVSHSIYKEEYERLKERLATSKAGWAFIKRKTGPETLFAEGKMFHGLRRARYRGLEEVNKQFILIATVQNLKKLIKKTFRQTYVILAQVMPISLKESCCYSLFKTNYFVNFVFKVLNLTNNLKIYFFTNPATC